MAPYDELVDLVKRQAAGAPTDAANRLEPNETQKITLIVIGVYALFILIAWNVILSNYSQWPFMSSVMLRPGVAQALECTVLLLTLPFILARLMRDLSKSITLDPNEGGATTMAGGVAWITLPAGYLGSSVIGALLVFAGFNTNASKVASFVLAFMFLLTLWWARKDWLTIAVVLAAVVLLVAGWFIAHSEPLRYIVLFVGVMSCLYSLFDISDDLIFRKVNESDASVFAKEFGGSAQCWGVLWLIISFVFFGIGIISGLAVWKQSSAQQQEDSEKFIPAMMFLLKRWQ